jgi:hypothetical protein
MELLNFTPSGTKVAERRMPSLTGVREKQATHDRIRTAQGEK